jgi:uncharacterized ion transporter superfamily protein YfcC
MFHPMMSLFIVILFFVMTPGVLFSLPKGGSWMMKAAVHAVVFALIYHFTHKMVWRTLYEGFEDAKEGKDTLKAEAFVDAVKEVAKDAKKQ